MLFSPGIQINLFTDDTMTHMTSIGLQYAENKLQK